MSWYSRSHGRRARWIDRRPVANGLIVVMVLLIASVIGSAGAESTTIASDAFTRTVTSGWGTADLGGAWGSNSPAGLSVSDGSARIVSDLAGEGRTATLDEIAERDVDIQAIWSVNKLATGSGTFVSSVARRVADANEYRAQVQIKANGAVRASILRVQTTPTSIASTAVSGMSYAPGTALRTRFQVEGTNLRFKMWAAAQSEPEQWLLQATDSTPALQSAGAIGIQQYLSGSSTTVPVTLSVSIFDAKTLGAPVVPETTTTQAATTTTEGATTTTEGATTTTTVLPPRDPDPNVDPDPVPAATPPSGFASAGTTVGTAQYAVPTGAIIVSPTGSDAAAGTTTAPVRTLGRAIAVASGRTIVMRAGIYHEEVRIPSDKPLTIQSWPGEAVWLDGSIDVSGWTPDGSTWRHDGWPYKFDHSPTDTRGAPDNAGNWAYVNAAYPMASHPDQMWVGGVAMRQVGSRAQVVAGTFFHDETAGRLYVGTDPAGKTVRASSMQQAMRVQSSGSIVRGIGIRRYAPSVPDFGALLVENANNVSIAHVAVVDNATVGVAVVGTDALIRNAVLARNGLIGMRATRADGLLIERVFVNGNNSEHFNSAPVAGGIKVSRTRTLTLRDSVITNNLATGFWSDVSNYNITVTGNQVRGNAKHGIFLEISAKALVANNVIADSKSWGLKINNTDQVRVWNNTFIGNNGSIWVVQDKRRPSNFAVGRDSRQPYPDPTMTWIIKSTTIANNVVANQVGGQTCMVCVQDGERLRTAEQMGVVLNASVYNRPSSSVPSRLVKWSRGPDSPAQYSTLPPFQSDTNQEAAGHNVDGPSVVTDTAQPTSAMPAMSGALPLPSAVAVAIGQPTGARRYGAWAP